MSNEGVGMASEDEVGDLTLEDVAILRRVFESAETSVERLATAVAAAQRAGECRRQTPYAELVPVLDGSGLRFCCSHKPSSHCSAAIS